jgi:hypothetical protein
MAYNRFTIDSIRKEFRINIIGEQALFKDISLVSPSPVLTQFLERYLCIIYKKQG